MRIEGEDYENILRPVFGDKLTVNMEAKNLARKMKNKSRIWVTISEEAKKFLDREIAKNASTTTAAR